MRYVIDPRSLLSTINLYQTLQHHDSVNRCAYTSIDQPNSTLHFIKSLPSKPHLRRNAPTRHRLTTAHHCTKVLTQELRWLIRRVSRRRRAEDNKRISFQNYSKDAGRFDAWSRQTDEPFLSVGGRKCDHNAQRRDGRVQRSGSHAKRCCLNQRWAQALKRRSWRSY
jgi:hypothetical protein